MANNISLGLPVMNALGNDLKKLLYPGGAAGDQATIIDVAAKIRVSCKIVHTLLRALNNSHVLFWIKPVAKFHSLTHVIFTQESQVL